jgi:phosphoenolpyruvate carboxykinase (GTP)
MPAANTAPTKNPHLLSWVEEMAKLCKPDRIYWCDGSEAEQKRLIDEAVSQKVLIPLDHKRWPGCYFHHSNPNDVARVEHLTFICTKTRDEAGPTNNWMDPLEAYQKLGGLFESSMKGRAMFVVPYVMGPAESPSAKVGIELTDSIYVALNMGIMTRMGKVALDRLGDRNDFNKGLHSVRDCHPDRRFICHFPEDNTIWSAGTRC